MEADNKELKCPEDYFFDRNLNFCISCKETCDLYRQATKNECQIYCSAYLRRKIQTTTADADLISMTNSEQLLSRTVVIVLGISAIVTCLVAFGLAWWSCRRRGRFQEKSVEKEFETECLRVSECQTSLPRPNFEPSSLCDDISVSDLKTPVVSIEAPPRRNSIPIGSNPISSAQETQSEHSHVYPTRPKTTRPDSGALQLQNVSAYAAIDLQEDFDCVEQTYDMARGGQEGAGVVLSDFSCDASGTKHRQISAVLQRLKWVKQFWWDVEGAKVVVDASHQSTAKKDITKILQREGIPSTEFSFQITGSQFSHLPRTSSSSIELTS